VCHHYGDAGLVGVSAFGVSLCRYVISWNVLVLRWLSILRINVVEGKVTDANGRNGGGGHSKTPVHNI
jgi:hypothetical protein